MSTNGFIADLLDRSNKFYKTSLLQFKFNKKILGTKIRVERVIKSSKYRKVFGSVYTSENLDDDEIQVFDYVALLNLNDMKKLFQKNIDQLDFFDNEMILQKGDVISYRRNDQEYQFKISEVETFSEAEGVLYRYQIMGLMETQLDMYNNQETKEIEF